MDGNSVEEVFLAEETNISGQGKAVVREIPLYLAVKYQFCVIWEGIASGEGEAVAVMLEHSISKHANPYTDCTSSSMGRVPTHFSLYKA